MEGETLTLLVRCRVLAFAEGFQQGVDAAAAVRDDGSEVGALGLAHAHAFDCNVNDAESAGLVADAPFQLDGRAVLLDDLAGDDKSPGG